MKFVFIPKGSFTMGRGRNKDTYAHKVTITRDFCIGDSEVTQKQWREILGENPSTIQQDDLPVANVSWNQITESFLPEFNRRYPGVNYRLPWEAQWEYAARSKSTSDFFFGSALNQLPLYGNCERGDGHEGLMPVKSFQPNGRGLYDVYGNVAEWVSDLEGDYPRTSVKDPTGPSQGTKRIRRGGAWDIEPKNCNSVHRLSAQPDYKSDNTGFRIVRDPVLSPNR